MFRYKSIIIENHRQKNKINHCLESRINHNLIFEDTSYYYNYTGMDSILYKLSLNDNQFCQSNLEEAEKIIVNELDNIFSDCLYYIPNDNKMNQEIFEQIIDQHILTILEASERFADLIFIDTESSNNLSTQLILHEADIIVVNISQDTNILHKFFRDYKSILSKCLFLINNYDEKSHLNLKKISKIYKIDKSNITVIPYNHDYKDALMRGSLISFIIQNYNSMINNENAKFVSAIVRATTMINNSICIKINENKIKEDLCERALEEVAPSF